MYFRFLSYFLQTKLQLYVGEVTNIRRGPLRNFRLRHVDSLISFLLLVRAKIMIRNVQNPFDQVLLTQYRVHANIFMFQFISAEYQTEVSEKDVREILVDVPHQKLIPAMFHLIWTKIRNESSGDSDSGDMQNWPLRVGISVLWFMF